MWKVVILACGLLDNQPVQCLKAISEQSFPSQAVCERELESVKIKVATNLTMMGLSPRVHGTCVCEEGKCVES